MSEYFSEMKSHLEVKEKGRQYQEYQKVYKRAFEDILEVIYEIMNMRKKLGRDNG